MMEDAKLERGEPWCARVQVLVYRIDFADESLSEVCDLYAWLMQCKRSNRETSPGDRTMMWGVFFFSKSSCLSVCENVDSVTMCLAVLEADVAKVDGWFGFLEFLVFAKEIKGLCSLAAGGECLASRLSRGSSLAW